MHWSQQTPSSNNTREDSTHGHHQMVTKYQKNVNQSYNEVSSLTSQNGHHQKIHKQLILDLMWGKGNLLHCWWECKLIQPLWRTIRRFLKTLGIKLLYNPVIPLLGIYSEKTINEKDSSTPMFIVSLFTIARTWKQPSCPSTAMTWKEPRCPSTDEQKKKLCYIYAMEYYSAIKKNCVYFSHSVVSKEPRCPSTDEQRKKLCYIYAMEYYSAIKKNCVYFSHSVVSNSLQHLGLQSTMPLCPWDSPGKNTGVGCHFFLQGIFSTQGLNLGVLHCRQILYHLRHQVSPKKN